MDLKSNSIIFIIMTSLKPKVIDCFIFYNEIKMLKFRLEYLYEYVDKFILVEATLTHSGKPKELYYQNNKHLFEKYNDKIIHVIVNDMVPLSEEPNPWVREIHHRDCIKRGTNKLNLNDHDLILVSDLDEIPNRNMIASIRNINFNNNYKLYKLIQDLYYYNLTNKYYDKWKNAYIVHFYHFKNFTLTHLRNKNDCESISNGGWHFSYFGDADFIKNKILNFAHQEYANDFYTDTNRINNLIKQNKDLFDRNEIKFEYIPLEKNNNLPECYEMLL